MKKDIEKREGDETGEKRMENLSIIRTIYEFKDYFREGGDLQRSELLGSGIKMNSIEDSQSIDGYFKKENSQKDPSLDGGGDDRKSLLLNDDIMHSITPDVDGLKLNMKRPQVLISKFGTLPGMDKASDGSLLTPRRKRR